MTIQNSRSDSKDVQLLACVESILCTAVDTWCSLIHRIQLPAKFQLISSEVRVKSDNAWSIGVGMSCMVVVQSSDTPRYLILAAAYTSRVTCMHLAHDNGACTSLANGARAHVLGARVLGRHAHNNTKEVRLVYNGGH